MPPSFLETALPHTRNPIFRLGLAASYRPGEHTVRIALNEGINYFFCYGFDSQMIRVLRSVNADRRERITIATGAYNLIWTHQDLRGTLEKRLRQLRTDYIDIFHFLGVMKASQFTPRVRDDLEGLRHDPRVRAVSISCHDRAFAASLASAGTLDCVMARYNAAHRGAESELFPSLAAHHVGLIAYTATRWRFLFRPTRHWPACRPVPTPGHCYRFVLSQPSVNVCLTAPESDLELLQNLAAVRRGPLDEGELQWMRDYGDRVHHAAGWFL